MSNKISKKATSATITKEELIKVILIFAACVLAAVSLPYMMLGKMMVQYSCSGRYIYCL